MLTTVEVSEETLQTLVRLSTAEGLPTAEYAGSLLSEVVEAKLAETAVPTEREWAGLNAAFGIWKDRGESRLPALNHELNHAGLRAGFGLWKDMPEDGLAYQQRMRREWDREWDR